MTVALDAKNAYCTIRRTACLDRLAELAPELLPFARLFSQRESAYYFWDGKGVCTELNATDGVDQGDVLTPLLLACGLAPHLRDLEGELRDLAHARGLVSSRIRVLAYLDDVAVLAPPELAAEILPTAQRVLSLAGLELQPGKTQAWSRASPCPPGLERQWRQYGLSDTLVGVPLGEALPDAGLPGESDDRRVDLYPDGRTLWRVVPFALETYGRLGRSALAHLHRLARDRASNLEEGGDAAASALVVHWSARHSTALHRANAAKIKHALGTQDVVAGLRVELVADAAG